MAKWVRWTGTIRRKVDVMSNADLPRIRPLESRVLGNLARTVREGADRKGRSRLPVTAVALRAHEPRHKLYFASRLPHLIPISSGPRRDSPMTTSMAGSPIITRNYGSPRDPSGRRAA